MNATIQFTCPQCSHTMQVHEAIRTWMCPMCGKSSAVTVEEVVPEANRVEELVVKKSEDTPNDATSPVNPESGPTSSRPLQKVGRFLAWGFCFWVIASGIMETLLDLGVIDRDSFTTGRPTTLPWIGFLLGGILGVSTKASFKKLIIGTICFGVCFGVTMGLLGPLIRYNATRAASEYEKSVELFNQGDADAAIACLTRAIEWKPDYVRAYVGRGFIHKDKGDHGKAIADYTEAIRIKPDYAKAYHNRGLVYIHLEEYTKAMADFDELIRLEPTSDGSYMMRGDAYLQQGKYARAITDYSKAIQLFERTGRAYFRRGVAYEAIGRITKASFDFRMAKDRGYDPNER